jgi:RNA polymerase sigma factor (sigma-70 family)
LTKEHQIWQGIKNSDANSLKELYQLYYHDLFNYGKRMTKDEPLIEDALQETFISIWKYRQTTAVPAVVKQYVLKIFRNQLLKIFKERIPTIYSEESHDFSFEISFDQKMIAGEDSEKLSAYINTALQKLTSRQREIIYYRFYENLSFEQISEIMNMQTRATYKLIARALNALKNIRDPRIFNLLLILLR